MVWTTLTADQFADLTVEQWASLVLDRPFDVAAGQANIAGATAGVATLQTESAIGEPSQPGAIKGIAGLNTDVVGQTFQAGAIGGMCDG